MSVFANRLLARYLDFIYQDTVRRRYAAQRACMETDTTARLLDVGCQTGINTLRLARVVGASRVIGVEYNLRTVREAARQGIWSVLADANRGLPLADDSIDIVTAMDVLEHLTDPRMLIRDAHRVLRPGGYLVLATPNLASWHNILALLLGLQPFSGPNLTTMLDADVDVVRRLHRRAYSLPEEGDLLADEEQELHRHIVVVAYRALLRLIVREGLHIEYARGFGYYPFPPLLARPLAYLDPWHAHHLVVKARKPVLPPT